MNEQDVKTDRPEGEQNQENSALSYSVSRRKPGGLYDKAKVSVRALNIFIICSVILLACLFIYFARGAKGLPVHFDSNGGSDVPVMYAEYGYPLAPPEAPKREGWTFVGWSLTDDDPQAEIFNFDEPIWGQVTFHAVWKESP